MKLSQCLPNTRGKLSTIHVEPEYQLRLQELGIRQGAEFSLPNRAAFGGVVLNIAGTRIAVDSRSAQRIDVEVAQ